MSWSSSASAIVSSASARPWSRGLASSRTIRSGFDGIRALNSSAMAEPMSASRNRTPENPSACERVTTSAPEIAAWLTSRTPPPASTAPVIASRTTTTPSCHAPVPISRTMRSAIPIPRATPSPISQARLPALAHREAECEDRRDGREEGLAVVLERLASDEPRERGRESDQHEADRGCAQLVETDSQPAICSRHSRC